MAASRSVLIPPRRAARGLTITVGSALVLARLTGYLAGMSGAIFADRVAGWPSADPARLSSSFGTVGNVLLSPAVRWDGVGYLAIADRGYHVRETILLPFYPMVVSGLGWVIRSDAAAAVVVSALAFGVGIVLLHRLADLELGPRAADATVLLLAFAPLSLFFSAAYTESLFLALSAGALLAGRRERWALAGMLAAAAAVTRVTGILLLVPLAFWQLRQRRRFPRDVGWLLLGPAALFGFLAYMQARGFGWLAPFKNQHAHRFGGPLATLVDAVRAAGHGVHDLFSGQRPIAPSLDGVLSPGFDSLVLLLVLLVAVWALILAFRSLPVEYGLYAALSLLVVIASETRIQPLEGIDRYTLTIIPLWMAAGALLGGRRVIPPVLGLGAVLLAFYSFEFARWAFVA